MRAAACGSKPNPLGAQQQRDEKRVRRTAGRPLGHAEASLRSPACPLGGASALHRDAVSHLAIAHPRWGERDGDPRRELAVNFAASREDPTKRRLGSQVRRRSRRGRRPG